MDSFEITYQVEFYVDNDPAKLAAIRGYSDKLTYLSKTRQIQVFWLPTYFKAVGAEVQRVDTKKNPSDMGTKILGRIRLHELLELSGVGRVKELVPKEE